MADAPTSSRARFLVASTLLEHALELLGPCDAVTIIVHGAAGEPDQALSLQTTLGSRAALRGLLMNTVGETLLADGVQPGATEAVALQDYAAWERGR
jgi:hypothetical protein